MTADTAPWLADTPLDPELFARAARMLDEDTKEIYARTTILNNARSALKQTERQRDLMEAFALGDVAGATKSDGKPLYVNGEQRIAAVKSQLAESADYADVLTDLESCRQGIDAQTVELEAHARRRQDVTALLNFASAWLRYHAAEKE
jgi:hypothetical protein